MGHSQNIAVQIIFVQITGHRNGNYLRRGGWIPRLLSIHQEVVEEQGAGCWYSDPPSNSSSDNVLIEAPESSFGGLQEA